MQISIDDLEHAAAPGWQPADTDHLGDWLLRAAGGFTGRANSALAAGSPGVPLPDAVAAVRRWYAARGLPPTICVPFPVGRPEDSELDEMLAARGWHLRADPAIVMTARAADVAACGGPAASDAVMQAEPDQAWLARYHYGGQELPPGALQVLMSAPWQAFGSLVRAGQTVAIGRIAAAGVWAGLTAIEVDPDCRGQGLGAAISAALAGQAVARGIGNLYLQVTVGNQAARLLYRKLGFTDHHQYHYRIAPPG